ncbi:MAG: hypothetical protein AABX31_00875 [Nanoarchaeota archaeon]
MWQQKVIYEGAPSGLFQYEVFLGFMKGKGLHIPYENTPLRKTELYVIEPATTLTYRAWKRVIPRRMDIWEVKVTLSGYGIVEVEQKLEALFTVECFE